MKSYHIFTCIDDKNVNEKLLKHENVLIPAASPGQWRIEAPKRLAPVAFPAAVAQSLCATGPLNFADNIEDVLGLCKLLPGYEE